MEVADQLVVTVTDASQVGEARRAAAALVQRTRLHETDAGRVALLVTELAGNLFKHTRGKGGELVVRLIDAHGVEVLALDKGPGMASVTQALRDGFSTAGTPGTGLGAVGRVADLFDVHSLPGSGTALMARVLARDEGAAPPQTPLEIGVVALPKVGEPVSGDAWALEQERDRAVLLVTDGLGHGSGAAEASREAVRVFRERWAEPPAALIERIHEALRGTRGAAVAVAEINVGRGEVRFAGVGNIAAAILTGNESRSMVSHNGTAGAEVRKVQEFSYAWQTGSLLVMHSDGINTRWSMESYPGLTTRHPALVAGVLYRDFCRGRDDATVAVVREGKHKPFFGNG